MTHPLHQTIFFWITSTPTEECVTKTISDDYVARIEVGCSISLHSHPLTALQMAEGNAEGGDAVTQLDGAARKGRRRKEETDGEKRMGEFAQVRSGEARRQSRG